MVLTKSKTINQILAPLLADRQRARPFQTKVQMTKIANNVVMPMMAKTEERPQTWGGKLPKLLTYPIRLKLYHDINN